MRLIRFAVSLAFVAVAAAPLPAIACSVVDDYRVPTNLELAADAQLIMLGKVEGGTPMGDGAPGTMSLTITPVQAIKGTLPEGPITLDGLALAPERFAGLSNPYELEGAHPLSYIGGCIRYMFPAGTQALFFLTRRDGQWEPAGGPFSRWAEDVLSEDAPWLQLTRFYTKVSALPAAERQAALEAERARYAADANDPVAQLMAADIARQLKGPNESWNAMMRRSIEGGDIPEGAQEEAAAEALTDAIMAATDEPDPVDCESSDDDSTTACAEALLMEEASEEPD